MFKQLSDFFDKHLLINDTQSETSLEHSLQLATAALLIEMTRADYEVKETEQQKIIELVTQHFSLTTAETAELIELAEQEADKSVTLHEFTSLLNEHHNYSQKVHVIELLWEIAYADGEIEKYEDYLVRKVADLLYVKHRDFIAAKHRVLDNDQRS